MHDKVCSWHHGHALLNPLRKLVQNPVRLLGPFVQRGMKILEVGPGMGFFTIPLARLAGPDGLVYAVDIQKEMLDGLRKRAVKAGFVKNIECRLTSPETLGVSDLAGGIDFLLAFAVVHEIPDRKGFFKEAFQSLKPGGKFLIADPLSRCTPEEFQGFIRDALSAGMEKIDAVLKINGVHKALLRKPGK